MRRKRFNHIAFTLCHMFCGWQLMADYKRLAELGSGLLVIDAKTARSVFNAKDIPQLYIALTLQGFLNAEIDKLKISSDAIKRAEMAAHIEISLVDKQERKKRGAFIEESMWAFTSLKVYRCSLNCTARIVTETAVYERAYASHLQWPYDFDLFHEKRPSFLKRLAIQFSNLWRNKSGFFL